MDEGQQRMSQACIGAAASLLLYMVSCIDYDSNWETTKDAWNEQFGESPSWSAWHPQIRPLLA